MIKGIEYTGIAVSFSCHDGTGNYLFHKRGIGCRDERGVWDCGGGGLKFNERLIDGLYREVQEEYGTAPLEAEFLGHDEVFREQEGVKTHWITFRYRVLIDREKAINNEPDKLEGILWTTLDQMPSPLLTQLPVVLEKYKKFLV
jgi:ADP-ribose pyrophosphatase YjhB (NUDIX family)